MVANSGFPYYRFERRKINVNSVSANVRKVVGCCETSMPLARREHYSDVLNGATVLTRLFGAERSGESRFWGMLGCGMMGVLGRSGRRMRIVDGGPALVPVPVPVPVLVWYAKGGDALLTRITRTLDRTSYHVFPWDSSNLVSPMA